MREKHSGPERFLDSSKPRWWGRTCHNLEVSRHGKGASFPSLQRLLEERQIVAEVDARPARVHGAEKRNGSARSPCGFHPTKAGVAQPWPLSFGKRRCQWSAN
jgi:hypothetical protein